MFNPALTACASERMKTQRFSYRLDVVCLCFDSKAETYYFAHSLNMLQIDLSITGDGGITRHRPSACRKSPATAGLFRIYMVQYAWVMKDA